MSVRRSDTGQQASISGRFLVAADGAGSTVRRTLQVAEKGQPALQSLINIHFRSPTLGRLLLHELKRPGMLYFSFSQQAVAVIVAHDLGRWGLPHTSTVSLPTTPGVHKNAVPFARGLGWGLIRPWACTLSGLPEAPRVPRDALL